MHYASWGEFYYSSAALPLLGNNVLVNLVGRTWAVRRIELRGGRPFYYPGKKPVAETRGWMELPTVKFTNGPSVKQVVLPVHSY